MPKPIVYIASPYTVGDVARNTRFQIDVWHRLFTDGLVTPIAPLWSHFQHLIHPLSYDDWVAYDNELIRNGGIDACLRLDAKDKEYHVHESKGADNEVTLFRELGRPVFFSVLDMYDWAQHVWAKE